MEKKEKQEYDFGEKKEENINGKKVPVEFHTPKYKEAKNKAIELIESNKYKGILLESDFWILVNTYANKTKVMYSGLIISHDGCLKINDVLEDNLKFKPECMTLDKEGYNNSLVYTYNCPEQGIYEVGEVSKDNCKNDYPYAMALKRCFDRVVLKNSKIAYSGIYSDSEAEEFKERVDDKAKAGLNKNAFQKKKEEIKENTPKVMIQDSQRELIKQKFEKEEIKKYLKEVKKSKLSDLDIVEASNLLKRKEEKN